MLTFLIALSIYWTGWNDSVFAQAKRDHKFVLLDLQAVWCHWCHVMDEQTYADPKVIALMNARYIAVKVDQDSRPDRANRYEDYGWPATVVFNGDGGEIVKRRGYIPPGPMARMLQAIIDDPTPGPSVEPEEKVEFTRATALSAELRKELEQKLADGYDAERGGRGRVHKYVDWDAMEYCLARGREGDTEVSRACQARATQTLTAGLKLIDPAWGGVYQYSTDGDWLHPHFEKIMSYQADDLRTYARMSVVSRPLSVVATRSSERLTTDNGQLTSATDEAASYLQAAQSIHRYLTTFLLSPDGAFYTSQDADLKQGEHAGEYFAMDDAHRRK